jgi:hypothetical protein
MYIKRENQVKWHISMLVGAQQNRIFRYRIQCVQGNGQKCNLFTIIVNLLHVSVPNHLKNRDMAHLGLTILLISA